MPYITLYERPTKFRLLISGFPNTGKTQSAQTFLYGSNNIYSDDPEEVQEALTFAQNKNMHIVVCPGELGHRTLQIDTEQMHSYYYECADGEDPTSEHWSIEAIKQFNNIVEQVTKHTQCDILFVDGLHALWAHIMNKITQGAFLAGEDLNINPSTGRLDPYRGAKFYNQAHTTFGQYIAALYSSKVPLIVCTTWEEWESGQTLQERAGEIAAQRYLWPAIPGSMARGIVGRFDARISARLERRCFHTDCEYNKNAELHHVWQFLPKGDVQGVGVKGLRVTKNMQDRPFIHQDWSVLQALIERYTK